MDLLANREFRPARAAGGDRHSCELTELWVCSPPGECLGTERASARRRADLLQSTPLYGAGRASLPWVKRLDADWGGGGGGGGGIEKMERIKTGKRNRWKKGIWYSPSHSNRVRLD
ncbi:hypothetical protein CGRA01v4_01776 [Colletotrichum graminicola]|nr:hypothetical protein CGRA01v4_01776 [Colletotrichum graminicola]